MSCLAIAKYLCLQILTLLHRFFDNKVAGVRASTYGTDLPAFMPVPVGCELWLFITMSPSDAVELVKKLPDKQCASDPLPTWLLKQSVDVLTPFLSRLINWSLQSWSVPSMFKSAYITPLLKKADLDSADPKSYRPISNLSVILTLLERVVSKQLLRYLKDNDLLPDLQSALRAHHLTETAVLKVLSDILLALDSGNLAILTLLDLSAAFDSVDHHTLRKSYGLNGKVIDWFTLYLNDRLQYIRTTTSSSMPAAVAYEVPQGSVLGPILFLLYTADLLQLIKCHHLMPHGYADDTQIYR